MNNKKKRDNKGRVLNTGERYREKSGLYEYRYTNLHKERVSIYSTDLNDLRNKESEIKYLKSKGKNIQDNKLTINEMYDIWKSLKKGIVNTTFANYKQMYEKHVQPGLGKRPICTIKYSEIKEFYISLAENGMKVSTIGTIQSVLGQLFNLALQDRIIEYNPCINALSELNRVDAYKNEKKRGLSTSEELALLEHVKDNKYYGKLYPFILTMLRTGMRVGEICALQKCDINWKNKTINVTRNLVRVHKDGHSYLEMHTPKTKSSIRSIPMTKEVQEAIKREYEYQKIINKKCTCSISGCDDFVFLNLDGRPYHYVNIDKSLKRIVGSYNKLHKGERNALELPVVTSHIFRHTCATRMNEANINDKAKLSILGHTDIRLTNEVYTDASTEFVSKEIRKLEDYIEKDSTCTTPHN